MKNYNGKIHRMYGPGCCANKLDVIKTKVTIPGATGIAYTSKPVKIGTEVMLSTKTGQRIGKVIEIHSVLNNNTRKQIELANMVEPDEHR